LREVLAGMTVVPVDLITDLLDFVCRRRVRCTLDLIIGRRYYKLLFSRKRLELFFRPREFVEMFGPDAGIDFYEIGSVTQLLPCLIRYGTGIEP